MKHKYKYIMWSRRLFQRLSQNYKMVKEAFDNGDKEKITEFIGRYNTTVRNKVIATGFLGGWVYGAVSADSADCVVPKAVFGSMAGAFIGWTAPILVPTAIVTSPLWIPTIGFKHYRQLELEQYRTKEREKDRMDSLTNEINLLTKEVARLKTHEQKPKTNQQLDS